MAPLTPQPEETALSDYPHPPIVTFICARIDETETLAAAATRGPWRAIVEQFGAHVVGPDALQDGGAHPDGTPGKRRQEMRPLIVVPPDVGYGSNVDVGNAKHIAHHNPDDALAQVVADRQMLDLHDQSGQRWTGFPRADRLEHYCVHDQHASPCPTVRLMAVRHASHPDYRPEWRLK